MQSSEPKRRAEEPPLGRPRTARLPRPQAQRAVQFMPFAALTGFAKIIREKGLEAAAGNAPASPDPLGDEPPLDLE